VSGTLEDAKGKRLNMHCPFDETTLRKARFEELAICPCCWTYFDMPPPPVNRLLQIMNAVFVPRKPTNPPHKDNEG